MSAELHSHSGAYTSDMKSADLHIHTQKTDGWFTPERLSHALEDRGLSAIALTDHDDISAGHEVREQFAKQGLTQEIIPGVEVTARNRKGEDAHIIGLYLEHEIMKYQSVDRTVDEIIKKGGIVVFPHPGQPRAAGVPFKEILEVAADGTPVLIETFNAALHDLRFISSWRGNERARSFYEGNRKILRGQTGGTDAHFRTVGRGLTMYDGDLRTALEQGQTSVTFRQEREQLTLGDFRDHNRVIKERAQVRKTGIINPGLAGS